MQNEVTFTIVMASYLTMFRGAAVNRVEKFHRSVASALNQTYPHFELFIISDGCEKTINEAGKYNDSRITCRMVEKQKLFSGNVRNFGIFHASGRHIIYLDTDDRLGEGHLQYLAENLQGRDWIYFDDFLWDKRFSVWKANRCDISRRFRHGTSNICHKKELEVYWTNTGYLHDYHFVNELKKKSVNHAHIGQGYYYVCHIPGKYDI